MSSCQPSSLPSPPTGGANSTKTTFKLKIKLHGFSASWIYPGQTGRRTIYSSNGILSLKDDLKFHDFLIAILFKW
jgi:hypothetical protein